MEIKSVDLRAVPPDKKQNVRPVPQPMPKTEAPKPQPLPKAEAPKPQPLPKAEAPKPQPVSAAKPAQTPVGQTAALTADLPVELIEIPEIFEYRPKPKAEPSATKKKAKPEKRPEPEMQPEPEIQQKPEKQPKAEKQPKPEKQRKSEKQREPEKRQTTPVRRRPEQSDTYIGEVEALMGASEGAVRHARAEKPAKTGRPAAPCVKKARADTGTRGDAVRAIGARAVAGRVTALLLCFTLLFGTLTLILPKKKVSQNENRVLAALPSLRLSALADGSFQKAFESWFSDHFAGRDGWIALHRVSRRATGQTEANGVYVGKAGHLFLIPAAQEEQNVAALAEAINGFAAAHPELKHWMALAPNAVSVQRDYLPAGAPAPDQQAQIAGFIARLQNVNSADLYAALAAHANEDIYYKTDHHWTSLGAKYAFEAVAAAMELENPVKEYQTVTVTDRFRGTLSAKSGVRGAYDSVELYLPQTEVTYYVQYPDSGETLGSMYRREALEGQDGYAVFFGGNYARVVIRTTAETGRRLLVFKDSYANAMMQFLYPYFDEIVMVDPRYFYDSIQPVLNEHGITDVLWLYNADTFFADTSLADTLGS